MESSTLMICFTADPPEAEPRVPGSTFEDGQFRSFINHLTACTRISETPKIGSKRVKSSSQLHI